MRKDWDSVRTRFASEPVRALRISSRDGDELSSEADLLRTESARDIRRLTIEDVDLGVQGLNALVSSPFLDSLMDLRLIDVDWGTRLGPRITQELANCVNLAQLRHLEIASAVIGPAGIRALGTSTSLLHLEELHLHNCDLGDAGILALQDSAMAPRLRRLAISMNGITDVGVDSLSSSPALEGLEWIDVAENPITEDARSKLSERFGNRSCSAYTWPA